MHYRPLWLRIIFVFAGIILIILGTISGFLPVIPGFVLVIIGLALLIRVNPHLGRWLRRQLHKIGDSIRRLQKKAS